MQQMLDVTARPVRIAGSVLLLGVAVLAAAVTGGDSAPSTAASVPRPVPVSAPVPALGSALGSAIGPAIGPAIVAQQPTEAVDALLANRSTAVLRRDKHAWLDSVDPEAQGFRAQQAALFDRLVALPLTRWRYDVLDDAPLNAVTTSAAVPGRADGTYRIHALLAFRLLADTRDVERERYFTLAHRSGRWLITAEDEATTARDLWDLGPVAVARGVRSLVIGDLAAASNLAQLARETDAAARRVDAVWGTGWPRTVVVLVPGSVEQMATLLDRSGTGGLDQLAAMTSGDLVRGEHETAPPDGMADRVVLNPVAYQALTALGRRVVLTHEVTHVATRASGVFTPPIWLTEGFADYVAYRQTGLPRQVIGADVLALVRKAEVPAHLPGPAEFDPAQLDVDPAYAGAWLACDLIARQDDVPRLVAFYRAVSGLGASGPAGGSSAALSRAFTTVLGESQAAFERDWQAYLRALAGASR